MRSKVYFKSTGVKICGILNVPKKQKNKDFVMVFCHGWLTSKNSSKIAELSSKLAEKGINSFAFDFFGHGESRGKLENISQTIAVQNVNDAVSFLRKKGYKKFGLYGSSFGGGTATVFAAKSEDLSFLCLISTVTKCKASWPKSQEHLLKLKNNFAEKFSGDLKKYNYISLGKKIKIPVLIVQGNKDISTPLSGAKKLLKNLAGEKMTVIIKGAGHNYEKKKQREDIIKAIYNFVIYNLPKH